MAYAAATDSTAVIEIGYNENHNRKGYSLVMDFNGGDGDTYELYGRTGSTTASGIDTTYSVGIVKDYHGRNSYSGEFVCVSGSIKDGYSIDYCQSPKEKPGEGARAITASFSIGTSTSRIAFSYDYYVPIAYWH